VKEEKKAPRLKRGSEEEEKGARLYREENSTAEGEAQTGLREEPVKKLHELE